MMYRTGWVKTVMAVLGVFSSMVVPFAGSAQNKGKEGQVFKDCPDCPDMVVIPAGAFTMGSPGG